MGDLSLRYVFPATHIEDFVKFTNDFTVWQCEATSPVEFVIAIDNVEDVEEEQAHLDEYIDRYFALFVKANK